jgi:hypothetical protein
MSITYDPEKWSDPLKARDFEPVRKKSEGAVLVSLRELRYFRNNPDVHAETLGAFLKEEGNPEIDEKKEREERADGE